MPVLSGSCYSGAAGFSWKVMGLFGLGPQGIRAWQSCPLSAVLMSRTEATHSLGINMVLHYHHLWHRAEVTHLVRFPTTSIAGVYLKVSLPNPLDQPPYAVIASEAQSAVTLQ